MPQKISAQNVCPSPKVQDLKKISLWVSVVRGRRDKTIKPLNKFPLEHLSTRKCSAEYCAYNMLLQSK